MIKNPDPNIDVSIVDLKDNIYSHLNKSRAILTAAMFALEFIRKDMVLDGHTLYHVLWAVDDYLEDN